MISMFSKAYYQDRWEGGSLQRTCSKALFRHHRHRCAQQSGAGKQKLWTIMNKNMPAAFSAGYYRHLCSCYPYFWHKCALWQNGFWLFLFTLFRTSLHLSCTSIESKHGYVNIHPSSTTEVLSGGVWDKVEALLFYLQQHKNNPTWCTEPSIVYHCS